MARYLIYARRNEKEKWTHWNKAETQVETLQQEKLIKGRGWLAKVYDVIERKIIAQDD
jgi:hypothetical protein